MGHIPGLARHEFAARCARRSELTPLPLPSEVLIVTAELSCQVGRRTERLCTADGGGRGAASRRRAGPDRQFVDPSSLAAGILPEEGRLCGKVGGSRGDPGRWCGVRHLGGLPWPVVGTPPAPHPPGMPGLIGRIEPSLFLQLLKQPWTFQTGVVLGWELAVSEAASPSGGGAERILGGHLGYQSNGPGTSD